MLEPGGPSPSIPRWLATAGLGFLGWMISLLGLLARNAVPPPEASLTRLDGVPRLVEESRTDATEGSGASRHLAFTLGDRRIYYSGADANYEGVVAAVKQGGPIAAWISTERWSLRGPVSETTLYRLDAAGRSVLGYGDVVRQARRTNWVLVGFGVLVMAIGLRLGHRFFRPDRIRTAPASDLASATDLGRSPFLIDRDNQSTVDRSVTRHRPSVSIAAIFAGGSVLLMLWLGVAWHSAAPEAWRWSVLGWLGVAVLGFLRIVRHRSGLYRIGRVVLGRGAFGHTWHVDDDGSDLDVASIRYEFEPPSGIGRIGGTEYRRLTKALAAGWPPSGARSAVAVLYFGPRDYEVL